MPFLEIAQRDLGPDAERIILAHIEAVMLWPDDPAQRQRVEHAAGAEDLANLMNALEAQGDILALPMATVAEVVNEIRAAPRLRDIQATVKEPFLHGVMVGFVLHLVIGYSELRSPRAQLTRVKREVAAMFKVSPSAIENIYWKRNKCVSPLWAAFLTLGRREQESGKETVFPCRLAELAKFLAISEWHRRKAEGLRMKQSRRGTLLKANEAWTINPKLSLPEVNVEFFHNRGPEFSSR